MPKLQNWEFYTQVTLNADKFKPYANMKLLASIVRHNHGSTASLTNGVYLIHQSAIHRRTTL